MDFILANNLQQDTVVVGRGWDGVFFDGENRNISKLNLDGLTHPNYGTSSGAKILLNITKVLTLVQQMK